jgi:hypothetical protein
MDQVSATCGNPYLVCRESDAARPSNTGLEMSTSGFFGGKISQGRFGILRNSKSAKAGINELEAMRMAGINVSDINQRSENDDDIYLVDNNCTKAWLQKTLNEHLFFIRGMPIPNPGYTYNIWGRRGLVSTLLKGRSLTVDDINLVQQKQYFMRIYSLIETAKKFQISNFTTAGRSWEIYITCCHDYVLG